MSKPNLPEMAEIASVVGSIVATVPAIIYNQAALACVPISLSLALNVLNRRQLVTQLDSQHQNVQAQLAESRQQDTNLNTELGKVKLLTTTVTNEHLETRSHLDETVVKLEQYQNNNQSAMVDLGQTLTAKLEQQQSSTEAAAAQLQQTLTGNLEQYQGETQAAITEMVQTFSSNLSQATQYLQEQHDNLQLETAIIANKPEAYCQRALNSIQAQQWESALADYTKAIEIAPDYAPAYRDRGLAKAELGDKKAAMADLRKATQLFFDSGDIPSYDNTRELSKNLHELRLVETSPAESAEPATVNSLFA
jgi:tetratricopeptide (TPR) repeat protein